LSTEDKASSNANTYRETLPDDESLALFLSALRDFDKAFCDAIAAETDFTLKLEVHGNKGQMIHARVQTDGFRRPSGVEKRVNDNGSKTRKSVDKSYRK